MNTTTIPNRRRVLSMLAAGAVLLTISGCTVTENLIQGLSSRYTEQQELAEERKDLREALAEQRREERSLAAQQGQYEREFCLANQEALQRNVKRNVRDTVASKVAFDVTSGFDIGELEVDQEALKKLLEKREQEALQGDKDQEALESGCSCLSKECGCRPHLQKKHCTRCRHKRCDKPEPGCGGPEALQRITQEPLQRPLRPAEIPLKLPVRLTFGMESPEIQETKVRREPLLGGPQEALEGGPCDGKSPVQKGHDGRHSCPLGTECPLPPAPVPDGSVQHNGKREWNDVLSAKYFSNLE